MKAKRIWQTRNVAETASVEVQAAGISRDQRQALPPYLLDTLRVCSPLLALLALSLLRRSFYPARHFDALSVRHDLSVAGTPVILGAGAVAAKYTCPLVLKHQAPAGVIAAPVACRKALKPAGFNHIGRMAQRIQDGRAKGNCGGVLHHRPPLAC